MRRSICSSVFASLAFAALAGPVWADDSAGVDPSPAAGAVDQLKAPQGPGGPTLGTSSTALAFGADNLAARPNDYLLSVDALGGNLTCRGEMNESDGLISGVDFGPGGVLYSFNQINFHLATVDPTTGASVLVGVANPGTNTVTGMAWDAVNSKMWVVDSLGGLWTISTANGALGARVQHTNSDNGAAPFLIDVANEPGTGRIIGFDLNATNARAVVLNGSGVSTPIGSFGTQTNFSQGMEFSDETGSLFVCLAGSALGHRGDWGRINLTTGAFTSILLPLPTCPGNTNYSELGDFGFQPVGGPCEPCDSNCDGEVDAFDIEEFIKDIFENDPQCSPCASDADGSGFLDAFDIAPFIDCLFGP